MKLCLLPRSLTGRVLLVVVVGLVVAHAASFALFALERSRTIDRLWASEIAAMVTDHATAGPAVLERPPGGGPRLRSRLRWTEVASLGEPPADSEAASATLSSEVRRLLADGFGSDPVVWLSMREVKAGEAPVGGRVAMFSGGPMGEGTDKAFTRPAPPPPQPGGAMRMGFNDFRGPPPTMARVTLALRFTDGRQVLAEAPLMRPATQVPTDAWISIALLFAVVAAFSIYAARLAVKPVRMLAEAADRLSRNLDEAPLPEHGAAEIRAAKQAFNRLQDRLRRHVNGRTLAFAAMSHDMRTPLTRMLLRIEELDAPTREKFARDLDEIQGLAQSALEVTRDLSPREALERMDVGAFVDRLARDWAAHGRSIEVVGTALPVQARPVALRRAVGNLLDNALKYGCDVSIEVADGPDHVDIAVSDRGPGIPAEELPKVTTPFYRIESSRNRGTGGAGLGLAIARDIVEGHGGELLLENRTGGGLRAVVRLPRKA
jgi:signal transduction histidine kinase